MKVNKFTKILSKTLSVGMVIGTVGATSISSYAADLPVGGHTRAPGSSSTYLNYYNPSESYSSRLQKAQAGTQTIRTLTPTKKDPMYNHTKTGYNNTGINPYAKINRNLSDWNANLATALPNCIGYAYGRTYETLGASTANLLWYGTLGVSNPYTLYLNNKSSSKLPNGTFQYGKTPKNNSLLIKNSSSSPHVLYIEKVTALGNSRYQLEVTESNYSARTGSTSKSSWSARSGWNCGDGTFNHQSLIYNKSQNKFEGRNTTYLGFIYLTEPKSEAKAYALSKNANAFD